MSMKLALASWSFPFCTLSEAAAIAKAVGVPALDIGVDYRAAVDRQALLSAPERVGRALRDLDIDMPCFYYRFGQELDERNLAAPENMAANAEDFKKVVAFCAAAGITRIFLLPGVVNPGQTVADALDVSAQALNRLLPLARDAGITLTVEAHVRSLAESPQVTLELLRKVPGLKLALDYSHFVCLGFRQEDIDPLAPHAAHVHLRQAKPGELQTKFQYGTINFPAMIGTLRDAAYDGYLVLENVHQDYMNSRYDDVLSEIIQMRDLVRRYI
jgi:sugar phosphate isomerase/epimerase